MLLAETFEFTDDDGHFMNKSQWLAHIRNGVDQYEQLGNTGWRFTCTEMLPLLPGYIKIR
jgi:hypothetical protein